MALINYADPQSPTFPPELLETIKSGRGDAIPTVYQLLMHSPGLLEGWVHLANQVRFHSILDPQARESVILLVAHLTGCDYEWGHHRPLAVAAGVAEATIAGLQDWPDLPDVPAQYRPLLTFAGRLATRTPVAGTDLADWVQQQDPQLIMEIAMTASYYVGLAHLILAFDLSD